MDCQPYNFPLNVLTSRLLKFLLSPSFSLYVKLSRVMFVSKREWRANNLFSNMTLVLHYPSQVTFRLLLTLQFPWGSKNSQSCDVNFTHVDSPRGQFKFRSPLKHLPNTCGYNIRGKPGHHILKWFRFRRITMRTNCVTLHLLVCHLISLSIHENIFGKNVTSKCEAGGDKTFCEIYTRLEASRDPGFYLRRSM